MLMMQYSYFATISPEGCASILWKSADKAPQAAEIMGITPNRLKELDIIDKIIDEPLGGAHRDPAQAADALKKAVKQELDRLAKLSVDQLLETRYDRIMRFGRFQERN